MAESKRINVRLKEDMYAQIEALRLQWGYSDLSDAIRKVLDRGLLALKSDCPVCHKPLFSD